ncbi:hypothetical protein GR183_17490 [Stappia sp. GBMRC 2046]|uniref:Uncharacterized protein n=2 Tax=Stappia sediminis TaxID=2692190 RepID=A0A7X3LX86_9HYPH|nr:hypothetical protein [Stappia sediminis]
MESAGEAEIATRLRGLSAEKRARIAFARLREAEIEPERLLAIHIAVSAIIEDDRGSHNVPEFRLVQTAKAAHRLASGTHRAWERERSDGSTFKTELHAYPKSAGRVLRILGQMIETDCELATERAVEPVLMAKRERFGLHPSHLPGWRPRWARN